MRRAVLLLAILAGSSASVVATHRADAQDAPVADDAATAFAEGERAFQEGDYGRAAAAFDRAYAARPHEAALWNAARSYERAVDEVRAANRYRAFLDAAGPNAPDRDRATAALSALVSRIGRLDIVAPSAQRITVDGAAATQGTLYVAPGIHRVEAVFANGVVPREIELAAGQRMAVTLSAPGAKPEDPGPRATASAKPTVDPPPDAPPRRTLPIWPASVLGGLTTISLGLSVASGIDVLMTKSDFDEEVARGASLELQRVYIDQGVSKTTRTNILYGVTGALAIATAITFVFSVDWSDTPARATVTPGGGSVVVPF